MSFDSADNAISAKKMMHPNHSGGNILLIKNELFDESLFNLRSLWIR